MRQDITYTGDMKGANRQLHLLLYAAVFCAASVLTTGYRIYFHNHALQLPLVRLLNDPTLYPNDPFAATLPYYASLLWRVVAWLVRAVPMEPLLMGLFVAERLLVIYAAGNLARVFAPGSRLAPVGAMAFFAMSPPPILGGGTLILPYFEQTSLAVAFFMLAAAAFHRAKPVPWALFAAMGFNCNSMYGAYALTYFGAAFLLDSSYRREWKHWFAAFGLFLVLALPEIALTVSVLDHGKVNASLWFAAAQARVPHHIFPTTWPLERFVRFGILLLVACDALWLSRGKSSRLFRHGMVWAGISVGWLLVAFAAEALKSPSMMVLQPARATDLWYAFGTIAVMAACCGAVEEGSRHRAVIVLALIPWAVFWPASAMWVCLLLGFAVLAWSPIWWKLSRRPSYAVGLVALLTLASGAVAMHGRMHATGTIRKAIIKTPCRSITQVCTWARKSTPRDAVFLIDPDWGEFRALSLRPVFVTWKDGSALLWYRPYAGEWVERMRAIGYDPVREKIPGNEIRARLAARYDDLTDQDVRSLSARYRISYWMVPPKHASGFPVAYQNRYFKVLALLH